MVADADSPLSTLLPPPALPWQWGSADWWERLIWDAVGEHSPLVTYSWSPLRSRVREALPEFPNWSFAVRNWTGAAEAVAELRRILADCSAPAPAPAAGTRPILRDVLHEVAGSLTASPELRRSEFALGYRSGLDAAREHLLRRAEQATGDGSDHLDPELVAGLSFPGPPDRYLNRPRPPADLDEPAPPRERVIDALRQAVPALGAAVHTEIADRLLRHMPTPSLAEARGQWALHEDAIAYLVDRVEARLGCTLSHAYVLGFLVRVLHAEADTGYDAAHQLAVKRLRTRADEIHPVLYPAHRPT